MSDRSSEIEYNRSQLVSSLHSVAESLRHAAVVAEQFANVFKLPQEATGRKNALDAQPQEHQQAKRKADDLDDAGDVAMGAPKKGRRVTRIRKPRDPNAPKRPASSYIMFQNQARKDLKAKHPNMPNAELLALISKQWSEMADEQKEIYHTAQARAKEKYTAEKAAYDAGNVVPPQAKAAPVQQTPKPPLKPSEKVKPPPVLAPPPKQAEVVDSSDDDDEESDESDVPKQKAPVSEDSSDDDEEDDDEEEDHKPAPKKAVPGKPVAATTAKPRKK